MEVSYSAGPRDVDRTLKHAQAERPGQPIRMRIQPTVLRQKPGQKEAQHTSWPGVSWVLECQTVDEAAGIRKALEAFFVAIAQHGPREVERALTPPVRA